MDGGRCDGSLPPRTLLPALPEPAFDRFAELTRRVIGVPTALVTLVDSDRQAFPGAAGLPEPWQTQRETPLTHSFCQHVVIDAAPLVIGDARADPLLATNLAIADLGVVAYAGMPLTNSAGDVIGSLCAIDSAPRDWTAAELANLADLAAACSAELQLRELATATQVAAELTQELIDSMPVGYLAYDGDWRVTAANAEAARIVAARVEDLVGHTLWDLYPATVGTDFDVRCRRVRDTGVAEFFEYFYPAPLHRWYEIRVQRTGPGIAVFFTDVTERRRAQDLATLGAEHDRSVAQTLQRALLTPLPTVPGIELAARYLPAESSEQVGGDWYDAVVQPDGTLMVAVGDVGGHGIEAAATMGQLRAMLRGFLWDDDGTVAQAVSRLDSAAQGNGETALATLISGRIVGAGEPGGVTFRWTNAGHPPALVLHADGTVERVEAKPELMLGVDATTQRSEHVTALPPRSTLVLYTDGVVETAQQAFDTGIDRLTAALTACRSGGLDELLDGVLGELRNDPQNDDVAMLAVRMVG